MEVWTGFVWLKYTYSPLVGFRDHGNGATGCITGRESEQLDYYKLSKKNFYEIS